MLLDEHSIDSFVTCGKIKNREGKQFMQQRLAGTLKKNFFSEFTMKHLNQCGTSPEWAQQFHAVKAAWTPYRDRPGWVLVESEVLNEQLKGEKGTRDCSLRWLWRLLSRKPTTDNSAHDTHLFPQEESVPLKGETAVSRRSGIRWQQNFNQRECQGRLGQDKLVNGFLRTFFSLYDSGSRPF